MDDCQCDNITKWGKKKKKKHCPLGGVNGCHHGPFVTIVCKFDKPHNYVGLVDEQYLHKFCGHIPFIYLVGTKCLSQLPTCMVTIVYISYLCTYDTITLGTTPKLPRLLDLLWFLSFFFLQDHLQSVGCVAGVEGSVGESQSHWFTFSKKMMILKHTIGIVGKEQMGSCAHSKRSGFHGDDIIL